MLMQAMGGNPTQMMEANEEHRAKEKSYNEKETKKSHTKTKKGRGCRYVANVKTECCKNRAQTCETYQKSRWNGIKLQRKAHLTIRLRWTVSMKKKKGPEGRTARVRSVVIDRF